jgi:hypothetical protein
MTENEAYLKARAAFWAEQAHKDAFWAKIRRARKPLWLLTAAILLVLLAMAGHGEIFIVLLLALILAATWRVWAILGLTALMVEGGSRGSRP